MLTAVCHPGLDPGMERECEWKNWQNPNKAWGLGDSNVNFLF